MGQYFQVHPTWQAIFSDTLFALTPAWRRCVGMRRILPLDMQVPSQRFQHVDQLDANHAEAKNPVMVKW